MMPFSSSMFASCLFSLIDGVCTISGSAVEWISPRMTYLGSDFVRSIKGNVSLSRKPIFIKSAITDDFAFDLESPFSCVPNPDFLLTE